MSSRLATVSLIALLALSQPAYAETGNLEALGDISLEDLGNIVTSVSKRPEDPFRSAAAITVITNEDIRLSGATHIAELMRLVPGLQVAQVSSTDWAISSRGFNDQFANKLLVVVDGRTIYTPLFSGVYWDVQDVVLEDIERIEVIRGPGATLWGANAVNGVINIITKKAEKTQGVYVSQLIGTEDKTITAARYGGAVGDNTFYRAYAKYAERDATIRLNGDNGGNKWNGGKAGFRTDVDVSSTRKITVQGDMYGEDANYDVYSPSSVAPYSTYMKDMFRSKGANVLGRWSEKHSDDMESTFQAYYDFQSPDYSILRQNINTFDFDYQTSWALNDRHQLVWGAGYRLVSDQFEGSPTLSLSPDDRDASLYSAFLQDTISLVPKTLDLTLGTKMEHNDYTGFEVQPNARLAWYPTNNQTVWASVARAIRTPSRAEDDIRGDIQYDPINSVMYRQENDRGMDDSEELIAYELGYRIRTTTITSIDVAGFYNDYNKLRTFEFFAPEATPSGVIIPVRARNLGEAKTLGAELSATWDVTDRWSLLGSYSYITLDTSQDSASTDISLAEEEDKIPHNQFNIRSNFKITDDIELTNTIYYVDKLQLYNIDDYLRFDTRIAWKVDSGIDVALVGQNLLDNAHQEFGASLQDTTNQIQRAVYARVTFRY